MLSNIAVKGSLDCMCSKLIKCLFTKNKTGLIFPLDFS